MKIYTDVFVTENLPPHLRLIVLIFQVQFDKKKLRPCVMFCSKTRNYKWHGYLLTEIKMRICEVHGPVLYRYKQESRLCYHLIRLAFKHVCTVHASTLKYTPITVRSDCACVSAMFSGQSANGTQRTNNTHEHRHTHTHLNILVNITLWDKCLALFYLSPNLSINRQTFLNKVKWNQN